MPTQGGKVRGSFPTCRMVMKFLSDFDARVRAEVMRGEHYRRGAEYMMYLEAIQKYGFIDLRYEGSTRFEGARQLADLNFLRNISAFH